MINSVYVITIADPLAFQAWLQEQTCYTWHQFAHGIFSSTHVIKTNHKTYQLLVGVQRARTTAANNITYDITVYTTHVDIATHIMLQWGNSMYEGDIFS